MLSNQPHKDIATPLNISSGVGGAADLCDSNLKTVEPSANNTDGTRTGPGEAKGDRFAYAGAAASNDNILASCRELKSRGRDQVVCFVVVGLGEWHELSLGSIILGHGGG